MADLKRVALLVTICVFGFLGFLGLMGLVVLAGEAFFATAVGGCVVWACWLRLKEMSAEHPAEARGFSVLPLPGEMGDAGEQTGG